MGSFRLDHESISAFFDSWPALVTGVVLALIFAYLGLSHHWARACALLMCGTYGGFLLRGVTGDRLREQYPNAKLIWLLSIGFTTMVIGVAMRMAFPQVQGTSLDQAWLGVAFFSILAFVLANRKDKNVVR